jgi:hypothetical protein
VKRCSENVNTSNPVSVKARANSDSPGCAAIRKRPRKNVSSLNRGEP